MNSNEGQELAVVTTESPLTALEGREFVGLPNRPYGGVKCDTEFGFCACGSYHYPPCTCGHVRDVHGQGCAVKDCECQGYKQDHSWAAETDTSPLSAPAVEETTTSR